MLIMHKHSFEIILHQGDLNSSQISDCQAYQDEKVINSIDQRTVVQDAKNFPITWQERAYALIKNVHGTAFLITHSIILTAAHNIAGKNGHKHNSLKFYPGINGKFQEENIQGINILKNVILPRFFDSSGSQYKGYKRKGLRQGFGKFTYRDGGWYQEQWKSDKKQGKGKLYYQSNLLVYDGDWKNDLFQGYGKLYLDSPKVLKKSFNFKNLADLNNEWTSYQGQFRADMKHGRGILFLTNGEYFQGEFYQNQVHGQGVYVKMDGQKVAGKWKDGIFVE